MRGVQEFKHLLGNSDPWRVDGSQIKHEYSFGRAESLTAFGELIATLAFEPRSPYQSIDGFASDHQLDTFIQARHLLDA